MTASKKLSMVEALRAAESSERSEGATSLGRCEKLRDVAVLFKLHRDKAAAEKAAEEAWPDKKQSGTRGDFTACAAAADVWQDVVDVAKTVFNGLTAEEKKKARLANYFLRGAKAVRDDGAVPDAATVRGEKRERKFDGTTVRRALVRVVSEALKHGYVVDLDVDAIAVRKVTTTTAPTPEAQPAQDAPAPVDLAAMLSELAGTVKAQSAALAALQTRKTTRK